MEGELTPGKWYQKTWVIVVALIIFAPLGILLAVKNPSWSRRVKVGAVGLFGFLFLVGCVKALPSSSSNTKNTNSISGQRVTPLPVVAQGTVSESTPVTDTRELASLISVTDGDTLRVFLNGRSESVRIIGINTPEVVDPRKTVECFGAEASLQAKRYFEQSGEQLWLEADSTQGDRDKYQRLLRYVFTNDGTEDFGKVMIGAGYASEYTHATPYKYQATYKETEREARDQKRGLWADGACPASATTPTTKPKPTSAAKTPAAMTEYSCTGQDLQCSDFTTQREAQNFFDSCGFTATNDPHRLDSVGVGDGVPCESLP